ncbi:transposase [Streptomyces sp. NPDC002133]|uniref:transposase n=1 Tax=Streptomyces sp. NPDC002133 TaxID=3154409 RepID=UPI00331D569F
MGSKYTKRYSDEYKRDAIELVRSSGRTVTEVARELGISSESLRGWVKKALSVSLWRDVPFRRVSLRGHDRRTTPS